MNAEPIPTRAIVVGQWVHCRILIWRAFTRTAARWTLQFDAREKRARAQQELNLGRYRNHPSVVREARSKGVEL